MAWRDARGVTLVEATLVLLTLAILAAVAAPSASRALDTARLTRASEDMAAIKTAMKNFQIDTNKGFDSQPQDNAANVPIEMAVGDGTTLSTSTVPGSSPTFSSGTS